VITIKSKNYERFLKRLKQEENETIEKYDLKNINDKDYTEHILFNVRREVVRLFFDNLKKRIRNLEEDIVYLKEAFPVEMSKKEDVFPFQWMLNDKAIAKTLQNYRISDVLNYVFKHRKFYRERIPYEDKLHNKKYPYTVFLADKKFYLDMAKDIGFTEYSAKKYVYALCKAEIFIKLKQHKGTLYADGYFTEWEQNKFVKRPFLKDEKKYRKSLKEFKL